MSAERMERIRSALESALAPTDLHVEDQGHLHQGHPGARDGRGHFAVTIVSAAFAGRNPIERHRLVYEALGDMMITDIHALSINARTPQESS